MKIHQSLYLIAILFSLSCTEKKEITFQESGLEIYKPIYHFSPQKGWMNDPNGMFYLNGEYHLFFQHYPDSTVWGPMHWGHATSKDLFSWEEKPISIFPDSLGYIFSGSAVYDEQNTSGFGTKENPPIVAIFTYHDPIGEKNGTSTFQTQGIAYSLDGGNSWEKYSGNPVLSNPGIRDFRDPKVRSIQFPDGSTRWVMTLAVWDRVHFYESGDLKEWKYLGEFGKDNGAHGGVWECPDLLEMTAPDGSKKWVLLVSINPGGPQKGSATQYFIGNFENGKFTSDDEMIRWLDYGPDNYAGVTWSNLPESPNRTLFIGWMSNWLYSQVVPTKTWRSAMTIPRELSLFEVNGTYLVKSSPAQEFKNIRGEKYAISGNQSLLPSESFELEAEVEDNFSISFSNESGEKVLIVREGGLISIDRSQAGNANFHSDFAAMHSAPMSWEAKSIRIFMDASSIELFVNEGEIVMTSTLFPSTSYKNLEIQYGVENASLYPMKK